VLKRRRRRNRTRDSVFMSFYSKGRPPSWTSESGRYEQRTDFLIGMRIDAHGSCCPRQRLLRLAGASIFTVTPSIDSALTLDGCPLPQFSLPFGEKIAV